MLLAPRIRSFTLSSRNRFTLRYAHKMSMSLEYTPDRQTELKENIESVLSEIESAASSSSRKAARLVPISKIKPASDIQALYDAGYRHFGENYIQELADKAEIVTILPLYSCGKTDIYSCPRIYSGISSELCKVINRR